MSNTTHARILGLDVGERRIGVAISDPFGSFALPLRSITRARARDDLEAIARICESEEVAEVVAGLPVSLSGDEGAQAQVTRDFAAVLEKRLGLPVRLWDERLSSREADRRVQDSRGRGRDRGTRTPAVDTDAIAASIILQAYLDHLRFAAPRTGFA